MNTAQDVLQALANPAVAFTNDDIRRGWDLLKARHGQVQSLSAQAFAPGDEVEFDHRGEVLQGTVDRVNQKTVTVKIGFQKWKVTPTLLRKV